VCRDVSIEKVNCRTELTHPRYAIWILVRLDDFLAALVVASAHTRPRHEQVQHLEMTHLNVVIIAKDKGIRSSGREVIWRHNDLVCVRLDVSHRVTTQCTLKQFNSRVGPVGVWVCLRAMIDQEDAQRFFINHMDAHAMQIVRAFSVGAFKV
jgi:hypothetical protein